MANKNGKVLSEEELLQGMQQTLELTIALAQSELSDLQDKKRPDDISEEVSRWLHIQTQSYEEYKRINKRLSELRIHNS